MQLLQNINEYLNDFLNRLISTKYDKIIFRFFYDIFVTLVLLFVHYMKKTKIFTDKHLIPIVNKIKHFIT